MTRKQNQQTHDRNDAKSMLSALRTTTAIGAVSLTLAGWGILSHSEASNAAQLAASQAADAAFGVEASSLAVLAQPAGVESASNSAGTQSSRAASASATSTSAPTATTIVPSTSESASMPTPTTAPEPTATPTETPSTTEAKIKLDVVQWVQTTSGDVVAVVRDARGTLWYVWESDVTRIEQGLSPQHQPIPVNQQGRTRGS